MNTLSYLWNQLSAPLLKELFKLEGTSITPWSVIELLGLSILLVRFAPKINSTILKKVFQHKIVPYDIRKRVVRISRFILLGAGFLSIFHVVGLDAWLIAQFKETYALIQTVLDLRLCKLGKTSIDLMTVIYLTFFSWILVRGTSALQEIIAEKLLTKTKLDLGLRQAIASSIHYGLLFIGMVVLLQTAGIELSALTVFLGAVGIGLSLGLQSIINNFFSGLVILFERPIKIGDRVQVGDVVGNVVNISLRATTVTSSEGVAVVVPNSQFITSNVINWTHWGRSVGLKIPVTVPRSLDPDAVKQTMLDAAASHPGVLDDPAPVVLFDEFSNDTMKLSLRIWTSDVRTSSDALKSDLNFAICKRLKDSVDAALKSGAAVNAPSRTEQVIPSATRPGASGANPFQASANLPSRTGI